jgi:hypothetical protein
MTRFSSHRDSTSSCRSRHAQGFSLIEVSIVTAIVMLVAIVGIPAIGTYVIENKVPKVGEELQRFVARAKVHAQGAGPTPYLNMSDAVLANALGDSSIVSVQGVGPAAVIAHGLGGSGRAGHGTLTLAPASIAGAAPGAAFVLRLSNVNRAACPGLASVMQRVSDVIAIEGRHGAATVKDATATPPVGYDAARAEAECAAGDANAFVFTVR